MYILGLKISVDLLHEQSMNQQSMNHFSLCTRSAMHVHVPIQTSRGDLRGVHRASCCDKHQFRAKVMMSTLNCFRDIID